MAPGTGRATMLYGCYAMFGLSLVAALIIITMIWSRLALYGTSGTARVPTLWIVLGPLGQAITAAGLLGANAALAVPPELAGGDERLRDPVRGAGVGIRGAVDRAGHRADGPHPAPRHAVRADLVEPDLPGRHVRHRHHPTGHAHRAARVPGGRGRRLRRPAGHLGAGRGAAPRAAAWAAACSRRRRRPGRSRR